MNDQVSMFCTNPFCEEGEHWVFLDAVDGEWPECNACYSPLEVGEPLEAVRRLRLYRKIAWRLREVPGSESVRRAALEQALQAREELKGEA